MNKKFEDLTVIEQFEYIKKYALKLKKNYEYLTKYSILINNYNTCEFSIISKMNKLKNLILKSKLTNTTKLILIKEVKNIYRSNQKLTVMESKNRIR